MGQRHQVYLHLPIRGRDGKDRETVTLGLHHQWLYGRTAVRQLANFLDFLKKNVPRIHLLIEYGNIEGAMLANWSYDHTQGYFHHVSEIKSDPKLKPEDNWDLKALRNPALYDNNDGITVIDLSNIEDGDELQASKIKYCFYSLGATEGRKSLTADRTYTAEEYLASYYPEWHEWHWNDKKQSYDRTEDITSECVEILTRPAFDWCEKLTMDDLYRIFPDMERQKPVARQCNFKRRVNIKKA